MNKIQKISHIRTALKEGNPSIGSWMQIPSPAIGEIVGQAGYDWVAVDMEHGSITVSQLPDIFRSLELGDTLPLARLASALPTNCSQALDAGAAGVIVPKVESGEQLSEIIQSSCWPPIGKRGVGYSRANCYGKYFDSYTLEARNPIVIAMIESIEGVVNLESILTVVGLDAIFIGPYDLSASIGKPAQFESAEFIDAMNLIRSTAKKFKVPSGVHVVDSSPDDLKEAINLGYQFIAYSIDSVFLNKACLNPMNI